MKQKHILIGLGIVAVGITAYYLYKKSKSPSGNFSNLVLGGLESESKKCPTGYMWSTGMNPHQCVWCGTSCDNFKKNKN